MSRIENLTKEQKNQFIELKLIIYNSKFIDPTNPPKPSEIYRSYGNGMSKFFKPESFDYTNPETMCVEYWDSYIMYALLHGIPKADKGNKHKDTTKTRLKYLKQIKKLIKTQPSSEYLKNKFQLAEEFDELLEIIDEDIRNLLN